MTHADLPADKVADAAKRQLDKLKPESGIDYYNRLRVLLALAEAAHFGSPSTNELSVDLRDFEMIFETYEAIPADRSPWR